MTDRPDNRDPGGNDELEPVPFRPPQQAGAATQKRKLRSKDDEETERAADLGEKRAQAQGYPSAHHTPRREQAARVEPPTPEAKSRRPRVNFPLPDYVYTQLRDNVNRQGEKSIKSYILRILSEQGEIDIAPEDIEDQRGRWMREAMQQLRGEKDPKS